MKEGQSTVFIEGLGEMKTYSIVFLRPGANSTGDSEWVQQRLGEHLQYSIELYKSGKVHLLGPVLDEALVSGILIYGTGSLEEAKAMAARDPAVMAGVFIADVHPWSGIKGASLQ